MKRQKAILVTYSHACQFHALDSLVEANLMQGTQGTPSTQCYLHLW